MEGTLTTAPDRTGAIFNGNYNSVVPASALSGAAINGSWTLGVFDDNFNFTTGTLQSWSLSITQPVPTTPYLTDLPASTRHHLRVQILTHLQRLPRPWV